MYRCTRYRAIATAILSIVFSEPLLSALAEPPALFTEDQLAQGRLDYAQECATCHGAQLQNGGAPALVGPSFRDRWNREKLSQFYDYVHQNMPLGEANTRMVTARGGQFMSAINSIPRVALRGSCSRMTRAQPAGRFSPLGPVGMDIFPNT
jgi:cytochrome c2